MGTSSIFDGPVRSLLPGDYTDAESDNGDDNNESVPEQDEDMEPSPSIRWKDAKTAIARYVKGSSSNRGRVMNHYVGASGGSKQLAKSSVAGSSALIGLGRVLQDFRDNGIEATLQSLQVDYVGKGIKPLLSELVNMVSKRSDSKEDMAARGAANEAVAEMYDIVTENGGDIESLRQINELTFRKILEIFMSEYIFKRVMSDLHSRFEMYGNDPREAVKKEKELKDYVNVKVELRMKSILFAA